MTEDSRDEWHFVTYRYRCSQTSKDYSSGGGDKPVVREELVHQ